MSITNTEIKIARGTIHEITEYLRNTFLLNPDLQEKCNNLTPLARKEWIYYTTIPKKKTRNQR
jgi:hypothetical protein